MRTIILTLTDEQLAVIDRALTQMPYGTVEPLVMDINRQPATGTAARCRRGGGNSHPKMIILHVRYWMP